MRERIHETIRRYNARADAVEAYAEQRASRHDDGTLWGKAKQVSSIITVIVLGIIIILGITIYGQIQDVVAETMGGDPNDKVNNTDLQNSQFNSTEDFADSMELAPVILVVMIAAVVLAVVQRFR